VVKAQRVSESNSWSSCEARIVSVYRINNGSCHLDLLDSGAIATQSIDRIVSRNVFRSTDFSKFDVLSKSSLLDTVTFM